LSGGGGGGGDSVVFFVLVKEILIYTLRLFFFGHRSFIRNKTQTAVINMVIKRMLENKVYFLDVSYVSTYLESSEVPVRNRANN